MIKKAWIVSDPLWGFPNNIFFSSVILLPDHAIFQGDGVIYFVTAKVKQGWVNLDVEVTGAEGFTAANVRVVSQGTVAYIPSSWMVRSVDGDTLKVIYQVG